MHPEKEMNNVSLGGWEGVDGGYVTGLLLPTFIPLRYVDLTVELFCVPCIHFHSHFYRYKLGLSSMTTNWDLFSYLGPVDT